jgi:hypothetical protein
METSSHPVAPLRQRMLEDMRMRKLASKSQQSADLQSIWGAPRTRSLRKIFGSINCIQVYRVDH